MPYRILPALPIVLSLGLSAPVSAQDIGPGLAGSYLAARTAVIDGDHRAAAVYFENALAADPGNPMLIGNAIFANAALGHWGRASDIADMMPDSDEGQELVHLVRMVQGLAAGDLIGVRAAIEAGQGAGPFIDELALGWIYLGEGDMRRATQTFEAIAEDGALADIAYTHLALARAAVGDFEGADKILSGAAVGPLGVSERSVDHEHEAVRTFVARQADAIIVTGFTHSARCRTLLENFGGPVVETWNLRNEAIDLSVGYSNFEAAAAMTRYLLEKGYRSIAMVGGAFENNDQAADRHAGFLHAMRAAGRPVPPENVIAVPNPTTIQSGGALMTELMQRPDPPDAVFFQAELPAQGAMLACISQGLSVPGDVAIAGFGDLSLSGLLPVPMTTVKIRSHEIGRRAAEITLARLRGEEIPKAAVDVGFDLVVRASA